MGNANLNIHFEISFTEPKAHYVDVTMTIRELNTDNLELIMPVWTPGSYLIREFSKNIEAFKVISEGKTVPHKKLRKNSWFINTKNFAAVTVMYRVYAFEVSVRTSFVDASHAFLSPAGIFLYPDGMLNLPSTIRIVPCNNWKTVSTGLESVNNDPCFFYAPNFDTLYDSPFEVGNQHVFSFTAAGVLHEVAMYGGGMYEEEKLITDFTRIIEEETRIFGENPNMHFVFIIHNFNNGGGGLEHCNSTVLGVSRTAYAAEKTYQDFLGLVSHEYFHLWNVKRLRPEALGPFDYQQENYTTSLWIAEGFTAYYDNLVLRRAGLISPENYFKLLSADINNLENVPGRKIQTITEASFDTWIKFYRPNENTPNTTVSYYIKGSLIALCIDLLIIHQSNTAYSLDEVMKRMYKQFYKTENRGYTEAEFRIALEEVAGCTLNHIYEHYINGVEELDYNHYLGYAGMRLRVCPPENKPLPTTGFTAALTAGKLIVTQVGRDTAAWLAGISVNDELLAINGNRIADLEKALQFQLPGDTIDITLIRDGRLLQIPLTLENQHKIKYQVEEINEPSVTQIAVRNKWINL
ncbi:M61 family metallopeptidase [Mucilaginibacter arboris]|uniref:PDZ domain-containing protein n=1 Tax=Mucilaginibacter arboris TaxID=2682090 RepID=A0A7K1SWV6_9SPHI|nr:PDZ domain-containing protein [Mucilaginibacter arboris]MVN21815.1 PDZ domain-containing protein [Mucilaginibacter arboris]